MPQLPTSRSQNRVRDIMATPVHSIDMDESILNVKRLFQRVGCHHMVIMSQGRAHGVVSDRDILKVVSPFVGNETMERSQDLNTLKKRVHQVMSRNLITIGPDESITAAAGKMIRERVSCLPVVDVGETVVGIVTVRDFVLWSVGDEAMSDGDPDERGRPDEDILIIIDGNRCYSPNSEIAGLIREAAKLHDVKNGPGSAVSRRLPEPLPTVASS